MSEDQKCMQCNKPLGHEPVSFLDNHNPAAGGCHLRCVEAYHAQRKGRPDQTVTDKTLTGAQIDAVYLSALGPGRHQQADADLMHACTAAHNTHGDFTDAEQDAARKTVAVAYNARIGSK